MLTEELCYRSCIQSVVRNRAASCRIVRTSVRVLQQKGQAQSVRILRIIRIESPPIVVLALRPPPLIYLKNHRDFPACKNKRAIRQSILPFLHLERRFQP